ncbi:uncharacterized protein Dwil_GK28211 [Drosophila willistoni]|uniref:Uncharacterized protein n=2 Tax=Drosophila willistoni TaxID=7260 RepID=A0A0Q9X181_DROWI|nr:uncharacterized protein Dwil_GK28211 [Drosophila willistoni]
MPLIFCTDRGNICLNILEVSLKYSADILDINDFDCVAVMCDISSQDHCMICRMPLFLVDTSIRIPTVLIGNKRDAVDNGLDIEDSHLMPYFEMSVKQNLNIVQPFQWIIRKLLNDDKIMFVEEYAPWPPEPNPLIDNEIQEPLVSNCQTELSENNWMLDVAYTSPLPEDNDIW